MNLSEIAVIIAVAIAVFSPQRLPEIARSVGNGIRKLQAIAAQLQSTLNEQIQLQELNENEEKAKKADAEYALKNPGSEKVG